MPLLTLQSNITLPEEQRSQLALALAQLVAEQLNKPLDYVQIHLQLGSFLTFAGTTEPTAFLELRSLGLTDDHPKLLTTALCRLLEDMAAIPPRRVFLNFQALPRTHWGWNGQTFG